MQPFELTISEASKLLKKGGLSSVELTRSCLERIEKIDPVLKAFITVDESGALQSAQQIDKTRKTKKVGKLYGIPFSIKDLLATKGLRTTCGSKILQGFVPPYDSTVVERLKNEGVVILGKTTMDEFAMGSTSETCAFGVPQNPWKKGFVAGGSSGGSAVSVAAYQSLASLGSDTGGSIRQPASLCGVVGLKPTYGRVSRYGLTAYASSLDQVGPFCRSVEDCALILQAISGYDNKDSTSVKRDVPDFCSSLVDGLSGVKVGIPREYFSDAIDKQVAKIVHNGIDLLKERGAKIVEISLPHTEYCVAVYYIIAPSEASSNLARYSGTHFGFRAKNSQNLLEMYKKTRSEGFGAEVKRRILIGTYALSSGYYDAYYKKASQVRTLIVEDFKKAFQKCDVIASPVTPTAAWPLGQNIEDPLALYLTDILTLSANLAGIPGISVPGGFTEEGLPVGIQLQGPHFCEEKLLHVGWNLERGLSLPKRPLDV
jgi:aspartyl-tRNA(Asn)/glutamyl-tRNA(Gln) amidotransferase subunit A